ncbi:MAG TPA: 1,2-phenylacetyl-CoA epoxidase subunit PaaD [Jatrophihabitantaceae bacterium]|nr:1,2-phenylacetyl-CoA epoxidase subunit PaaD [Jatrophihabitantaceae bacterium]
MSTAEPLNTAEPLSTAEPVSTAVEIAAAVPDPELPMVTIAELGILRGVRHDGAAVTVTITPTYSGCPAMREISSELRRCLAQGGYPEVVVRIELSPPWSSDWITPAGRRKLVAAGIAAPNTAGQRPPGPIPLTLIAAPRAVTCPRCGSTRTSETAAFSGTACKALYRCRACQEPFEYVKAI